MPPMSAAVSSLPVTKYAMTPVVSVAMTRQEKALATLRKCESPSGAAPFFTVLPTALSQRHKFVYALLNT